MINNVNNLFIILTFYILSVLSILKVYNAEITELGTIAITPRTTPLSNDLEYGLKMHFICFNESFTLCLKNYSIFDKDITLLLDSDVAIFGERIKQYIPSIFIGHDENRPKLTAFVSTTKIQMDIYIEDGNLSLSIECPLKTSFKYSFKQPNILLTKCMFQKLPSKRLVNTSDIDQMTSNVNNEFIFNDAYLNEDHFERVSQIYKRMKRSMKNLTVSFKKILLSGNCVIHAVADHLYFENIGKSDVAKTIHTMVTYLTTSDIIFRSTDFNGDGVSDNIGIKIGNITIYRRSKDYKMKGKNHTLFTYLKKFSEYNFDDYCLAIAFSCRDFGGNTVGLAWRGHLMPTSQGGICQRRKYSVKNGMLMNKNTLVVSQLHKGTILPTSLMGIIVTHELGHSFGSVHDNAACSPGGRAGHYIMMSYTSDGSHVNNRRFSMCSIKRMFPVIYFNSLCFQPDTGPMCGNAVIEGNEECDCGTISTCSEIDSCCVPSNYPSSSTDIPCTIFRSRNYTCSSVASPCCSKSCHPFTLTNVKCLEETECSQAVYCKPLETTCSPPVFLANNKSCDLGRKVCHDGLCSVSVCYTLGLEECQCTGSIKDNCLICCKPYDNVKFLKIHNHNFISARFKNQNSSVHENNCQPLSTFGLKNLQMTRGSPCNDYHGYCTEVGLCAAPLETLSDMIENFMSERTASNIRFWLKTFWPVISFVMFLSLISITLVILYIQDKPHYHTSALRMGKLMAVYGQANYQRRMYDKRVRQCDHYFDVLINTAKHGLHSVPFIEAITRLMIMFPSAPYPLLATVARASSTEGVAVKMLLLKGYPIASIRCDMKNK